jgi:hypothetical protein
MSRTNGSGNGFFSPSHASAITRVSTVDEV